jgi:hypothetical protein
MPEARFYTQETMAGERQLLRMPVILRTHPQRPIRLRSISQHVWRPFITVTALASSLTEMSFMEKVLVDRALTTA